MTLYWEEFARSVFYSFIFVSGTMGNIFVVLFFSFKMRRAKQFRWYVVHLALADCAYAFTSPVHLVYLLATQNRWSLGLVTCKIATCLGPLTVNASAWVLVLMAYERYRCICRPFKRRLTKSFIHCAVAGVWVACTLLKIPTFLRSDVVGDVCYADYKSRTEYLLVNGTALLCDSFVPSLLQFFFFVRIRRALRKRAKMLEDHLYAHRTATTPLVKTPVVFHRSLHYQSKNSNWGQHPMVTRERLSPTLSLLSSKLRQLHGNTNRLLTNFRKLDRIKDKHDRRIVDTLFLSVLLFTLLTLPFNTFYFVVTCLYSFYFSETDIVRYERGLTITNDWLALMVLSCCVSNVFVYSGMFPDFRHQIYIWFQSAKRKISIQSYTR